MSSIKLEHGFENVVRIAEVLPNVGNAAAVLAKAANDIAITPTSTLDRLPAGSSARILAVRGEPAIRRRLLEMGLCTGISIDVIRRAPLGDPIELHVRGYLLSLRADQARHVVITGTP